MFCANVERRANVWHHLKIIWSAYFWNLVGALIIVGLQLGGDVWTGREVGLGLALSLDLCARLPGLGLALLPWACWPKHLTLPSSSLLIPRSFPLGACA